MSVSPSPSPSSGPEPEAPVFALDVGTRKVAGLWASRTPEGAAKVLAFSMREHPERAMLDGQVHHIEKASQVVREVKQDLERQLGQALREAHVAVAGRSLLTQEAAVSLKADPRRPLAREEVLGMELKAVREARALLKDPRAAAGSYCVGYSVSKLSLDGAPMSALEGHRGEHVEFTVLATFLPRVVLDSLHSVLKLAGLNLASLTLEPIAAASIALPADLRRLNLALVDVGAGTSDIALTGAGRLSAFSMAPLAGDEVTERLADAFLLDFGQAESLKRGDPEGLGHMVSDVFGNKRVLEPGQVWEQAMPAVQEWAAEVAGRILELNSGKTPQAVLLVGGGSQCPNMDLELAQALGIPSAKVGRRPLALQTSFEELPEALKAAWATTPLGIALMALEKRGLPYFSFRVNGERVQVLNLSQKVTAFDALLASGHDLGAFYGRPGLALSYEFNGQSRIEKGSMPEPARLLLNGHPIQADQELKPGDALAFTPARDGKDGQLRLSEALARESLGGLGFEFNGEPRAVQAGVSINGLAAQGDPLLQDRDKLEARFEAPLSRLLEAEGYDLSGLISRSIAVSVDGEPRVITQRNYRLSVNGAETPLEAVVRESDKVAFEPGVSFQERVRDLLKERALPRPSVKVRVNGQWREVEGSPAKVLMNGREVSQDEFLIDGAEITVREGERHLSVVELLAQLPFDSARLKASWFDLKVGGKPVPFNTPLSEGDEVEVRFEEARPQAEGVKKEA